jgi:xanthosine utilization system XapX-like protein
MPVGEPDLPEDDIGLGDRVRGALGRLAVSMVVLAGIVGVLLGTQLNPWAVRSSTGAGFAEGVLRQQISRAQVSRIEGALAVYRLERGEVPASLEALVDQGLLSSSDVRFPWAERYYYRRVGPQEFILLPPLR